MKPRLILHLGLSKTGTTTIQTFLRRNPAALSAAGVFYPKVGADNPDHPSFRPTLLRPDLGEEINHEALALEITRRGSAGSEATFDTPLWSIAFRQIEQSRAHTAILSYENFFSRAEQFRFDVLAPRLRDFEISGIIYLRRQEDWAASLYGQLIRGRVRFAKSFTDFVARSQLRPAYSTVLDVVKDHIPLDRLIIGRFEDAAVTGLLADFLDRTGLTPDLLTPAGDQRAMNSSLPHWANLFLLQCNRTALDDEAFLDARRALTTSVTRSGRPSLRPGLDVATPAERRALREIADADADRLAERYGVTMSPATREPAPYRPFDDEDFNAIRGGIAPWISQSTRDSLAKI